MKTNQVKVIFLALFITSCNAPDGASQLNDEPFVDTVPEKSTLLLTLSRGLLESGITGETSEAEDINMNRFGAHIWGTATQTGTTRLDMPPSLTKGRVHALYQAKTFSKTTGRSSNVTFWTEVTTHSHTRKGIELTNDGIQYTQAKSNASSKLVYKGANTNALFRNMVLKQAWKRLHQNRRRSEQASTNDVKRKVHSRMDQEAPKAATESGLVRLQENRDMMSKEGGMGPRAHFSTIQSAFRFAVEKKAGSADINPPAISDSDVSVVIHQDTMNELMTNYFAGHSVSQEELDLKLNSLLNLGNDDDTATTDDTENGFSILFAKEEPIKIEAMNDRLLIILKGDEFISKTKTHKYPMTITVEYKVAGNSLVKEDSAIHVIPQDFDPENDKLSLKQKVLIKLLKKHFNANMEKNLATPEILVEGHDPMIIQDVIADNGWLALSWKGNFAPQTGDDALNE